MYVKFLDIGRKQFSKVEDSESLIFPQTIMSTNIKGQNASGFSIKTSNGYVEVPEQCECLGVFHFNSVGEVECDKCHLIFEGI